MTNFYDLVVIGGGPGGMAAAYNASRLGVEKIVLVERENFLGGILPQCIHAGFGLKHFSQELTGPEYSQIFTDRMENQNIEIKLDTMALSLNSDREISLASKKDGFYKIKGKAIILALGCRERTRGAIDIPGTRPAGIYTAGVVQRMINIEGFLPGKKAVILGSGDIGLIMARRLTLEGCMVEGVYEVMPFSSGLNRNIAQCLEDFDIPLKLNSTVSNIYGDRRLEAVEVTNFKQGKKKIISCDALLLSVGLIPENELTKEAQIAIDPATGGPQVDETFSTSVQGIFACGNSLYVNDLVDDVTVDAYRASQSAANYILQGNQPENLITVSAGRGMTQVVPQRVTGKRKVGFRLRVEQPHDRAEIGIRGTRFKRVRRYLSPGELVTLSMKESDFNDLQLADREELVFEVRPI